MKNTVTLVGFVGNNPEVRTAQSGASITSISLATSRSFKDGEGNLLAREAHFPATIADLYEVKDGARKMPENLRHAHERNDEVLERICIGRRFRNDTERLEKLFELYTRMTSAKAA